MSKVWMMRIFTQSLNTFGLWSHTMSEAPVDWDTLTFSMTETDSMYITKTKIDEPWTPGEMRPYGNISISPAAGVMNYGQGLFEGMKAYRTSAGRVVLFLSLIHI